MADTVITLRPNGTAAAGDWTASAGTVEACTSDDSDSTYLTSAGTFTPATVNLTTTVVPALALIRTVTLRVRMANPGAALAGLAMNLIDPSTGFALSATTPTGTSTPVTYTVMSSPTAPGGRAWTQAIIDSLQVAFAASDSGHRIYEIYVDVVYNQAPSTATTAPTGTITDTFTPTITWTYTDPEGNTQERYHAKAFAVAVYSDPAFDPETSPAGWDSGEVLSSATSAVPGPLTNGATYRAYVKTADVGSGGRYGPWNYAGPNFVMSVDPAAPPTIAATPDPTLARVGLAVQGRTNELTKNQASLETDTTGWAAGANTSIARSTAHAAHGAAALLLTAAGAGDISANTLTGLSGAVVHGSGAPDYTFLASFRPDTTVRNVRLEVAWYTAAGAGISQPAGASVAEVAGAFTQATLTATPPSNAAFYAVVVKVLAAGAGEQHYVDKVSAAPGTSTTWTRGGLLTGQILELDRSADGGATWTPVTRLTPVVAVTAAGQAGTTYDHEAPIDVPLLYRARIRALDGVSTLVSDYSVLGVAVTLSPDSAWLKDPLSPDRNMAIDLALPFKYSRRNRAGMVDVLGGELPVVRTDGHKGEAGECSIDTVGQDEHDALDLLAGAGAVLLLQIPGGERDRYLFITTNVDTVVAALVDSASGFRTSTFQWVEVAAP